MSINWWTLGIQTVNVVILVWLLSHFFWRPVAAMIEQRRAATERTVAEAAAERAKATAALAAVEQTRAGFGQEREKILADAHDAAEQAQTATAEAAAKTAAGLIVAAHAEAEKAKAEAEKAWSDRASHLAVDVAARLASRLDGAAVQAAFLDWLLKAISALPGPERQTVAANGAALEAVSATALDATEQAHYGDLIAKAFDAHPQIAFTVDPALIAGLELHGPHFVVGNSWRADLTRILAELTH